MKAIVILGLSVILIGACERDNGSSAPSEPEAVVPVAGRKASQRVENVSLVEAMRRAEASIPRSPEEDENEAGFRKLLAAGVPVANVLPEYRWLNCAFAEALEERYRNGWLREAITFAEAKGRYKRLDTACKASGLKKRPRVIAAGFWIYEIVYNLATDANLRIEAKAKWDEHAHRDYVSRTEGWHRAKQQAERRGWTFTEPMPRQESIPMWDEDCGE